MKTGSMSVAFKYATPIKELFIYCYYVNSFSPYLLLLKRTIDLLGDAGIIVWKHA